MGRILTSRRGRSSKRLGVTHKRTNLWAVFSGRGDSELLGVTDKRTMGHIIEYASLIYRPCSKGDADRIERVQRRAVKYLCYKSSLPVPDSPSTYIDSLSSLGINSLNKRHIMASLSFAWKLFNNKLDVPEIVSKFNLNVPQKSLPSISLFSTPFHRTNYCCWSPLSHLVTLLNKYGDNADIFNDTLSMFKSNFFIRFYLSQHGFNDSMNEIKNDGGCYSLPAEDAVLAISDPVTPFSSPIRSKLLLHLK
ncbi:hypothetical protein O3M35_002838 [Rhynocoris fuscipes]|uniref:Maturase K n=1 Tax=Rhynocoris fuscipes TaxID=488301 RepID=A0AAW1CPC3_9HEMI